MSRLTIQTYSPDRWVAFCSACERLGVVLSDEAGRPSWPPVADRVQTSKNAIAGKPKDEALQRRVDDVRKAISGGADEKVKARAKETSRAMKGRPDDPALAKRLTDAKRAIGRKA